MDSISQAVLGASVGEAILGKKIGRKAAVLGAVLGTVPDLDVLLTPFFSNFQNISIHRGYSHSILFCLFGAFFFSYLLSKVKWTKEIASTKLWLFSFLALFTHVMLDAFTTYGTQLFLPFSDWRVSFDSINIVDPFYTIPLLIGVGLSIYYHKKESYKHGLPNTVGLFVSSCYLIFTLVNKQYISSIFTSQLTEQQMPSSKLLTVPVGIGNLNWYGVGKDTDNLYLGKYSLFQKNKIEFHTFPINDDLLMNLDRNLVTKMKWFAQDFYTVAQKDGKIRIYNLQCDMQGVRQTKDYKAPTAFYFEITSQKNGHFNLTTGMHPKNDN
jgi:inner membrane protein